MKKKTLLVLLIVGVLLLTGCGKKEEQESKAKKDYSIGDTMIGNDWEVTLKSAEFVDFMNVETDTFGRHGGENFGSTTIEPADAKYNLVGKNGNVLLAYTFEFKYKGKEEYNDYFYNVGKPKIVFDGEYTFQENFFNFVMDYEGKWVFLSRDSNAVGGASALSNMYINNNKYKVLDDTVYKAKGVIAVPEKVKNDSDASLTIQFDVITGKAFKIR